ncbi:MAG: Rpp14/Pop5 family protein [Candidatus Bathyarchaeia archaeon]
MPARRSRRYIGFRVAGSRSFTVKEVADAVKKGVLNLYGVEGLSLIDPVLIDFGESQEGVLRCNTSHLKETRAALTLITNIGGQSVAILVEKVSGTIKSLRKKSLQ